MEITNYFESTEQIKTAYCHPSAEKYCFITSLKQYSPSIIKKEGNGQPVAIVGVPFNKREKKGITPLFPDKIREELYRLAPAASTLQINDFGNLKMPTSFRGTLLALRDIIEYLRQQNYVTIILGGGHELSLGVADAFNSYREPVLSVIDARLDLKYMPGALNSTNFISKMLKNMPNLYQFNLIGYQSHLVSQQLLDKLNYGGGHLRLGELRNNIKEAELLLRSSHFLSFDMGAIKYGDASATLQKNPNGLKGDEACQLARYAGISPNLEVFGLFGADPKEDTLNLTAKLASEIIWYFLDGLSERKKGGKERRYQVTVEGIEEPLVFIHEEDHDRWWMEIRSVTGKFHKIACSHEDYLQTSKNEIPDRWLTSIRKIDQLLK